MTPESIKLTQYIQHDRDINWVDQEARLAGRQSNNKSLFTKTVQTLAGVGLGLSAAFGLAKPVDALVKNALDLDNTKPRTRELSTANEYFTQTGDTQEIFGGVDNFGMGKLGEVLVIPDGPQNQLSPYFHDAADKLGIQVKAMDTLVVFGSTERASTMDSEKVFHSDEARMPDAVSFAVVTDEDGGAHIIGGISEGLFSGLKFTSKERVVGPNLVLQDGFYGINTSNGFLKLFETKVDGTVNANKPLSDTSLVAFNGVAEGPLPVVTATSAPDLSNVDLTPQASEFLILQEQVAAAGKDYSIMGNGSIEGPKADGTIGPIEGIKLNPDGKGYTIMVNGAPVVIDADKVSITDAGISIDGYTFDAATGNFTEGFSLESWAPTTEHGAEFVSNLNIWNVPQEIKDSIKCEGNLCYDADGNVIFDASTGQYGLDFLQEALSTWGGVGGPQEKPDPRASRPNYPNDKGLIKQYAIELAAQYRTEYIRQHGVDPWGESISNGRIERILVGESNWMIAAGQMVDGKAIYKEVVFRPAGSEDRIISIPIISPLPGKIDKIWDDELGL